MLENGPRIQNQNFASKGQDVCVHHGKTGEGEEEEENAATIFHRSSLETGSIHLGYTLPSD